MKTNTEDTNGIISTYINVHSQLREVDKLVEVHFCQGIQLDNIDDLISLQARLWKLITQMDNHLLWGS